MVAGFLASEGVIEHRGDVRAIEPCRDPAGQPEANLWNVALAEGLAVEAGRRRQGIVGSVCGLCGARSLEDLERRLPPLAAWQIAPSSQLLADGFAAMSAGQSLYRSTGGAHGVALLAPDGELLDLAEDVGRHNAVDKVTGAALLRGEFPFERPLVLLVSGRLSFEILQKAALAGIGAVAGAGAPTSLAVEAARRFGQRLVGLVRPDGAKSYD